MSGSGAFRRRTIRQILAQSGLLVLLFLAISAEEAAADGLNLAITGPDDGATVSGNVTVRGTAASSGPDQNVLFVEVRIDSDDWSRAVGTLQWYYKFDSTRLTDGAHHVQARCSDGTVYSFVVGIDIKVDNGSLTGTDSSLVYCGVVTVVLAAIGIVLVFSILYRSSSVPAPPRPATGYYTQPPAPPYQPRAPSYQPPAPPYQPRMRYVPGGHPPGAAEMAPELSPFGSEVLQVSPEEGGALPPPQVVEYEDGGAAYDLTGGLEIEDASSPDAEIGGIPVTEVLEVDEEAPREPAEVMEAGESPEQPPVELLPPEEPSGPAPTLSGDDRHARVMSALVTMPRGLPLPLLGIPMNELADMILRAPQKSAPGGSPLVRLKDRWYHANETNLKEFMVEYKP